MKKVFSLVFVLLIFYQCRVYANSYDFNNIRSAKSLSEYQSDVSLNQIDTVKFGKLNNTPIEWYIMDKIGDKALLFSKEEIGGCYEVYDCGLDAGPYDDEETRRKYNEKNIGYCRNLSWENCTLRQWLNNDFLINCFNSNERTNILSTTLNNSGSNLPIQINNKVEYRNTYIGNDTIDSIFVFSIKDCIKYKIQINKVINRFCSNRDILLGTFKKTSTLCYMKEGIRDSVGTGNLGSFGSKEAIEKVNNYGSASGNGGYNVCLWVSLNNDSSIKSDNNATELIEGMPQQEFELRNGGHFYLNNIMQKSSWVYYISYYYHVDGQGNIEKSKWIEQRYVGEDGRMYRGR